MGLWSAARYNLHLSEVDFWSLTPRQFHDLMKRHEREIEHKELLNGMLAANIVNYSMGRPDKAAQAKDFMPSQWDAVVAKKPRMTKAHRQHIANRLRGLFSGLMQAQNKG